MQKTTSSLIVIFCLISFVALAQQKKVATPKTDNTTIADASITSVSKATLGTFPYFKTFPNFKLNSINEDSITYQNGRVYFQVNNKIVWVDGMISTQKLGVANYNNKMPSIFQLINDFDKIITQLGGKKIFEGTISSTLLKSGTGTDDVVKLVSQGSLVGGCYSGFVAWKIVLPDKEIWVQLAPNSLGSNFYSLLVVEKQVQFIAGNINKKNLMLDSITKNGKANIAMQFLPDKQQLQTESSDEILNIANVFQTNPTWNLKIEVHISSLTDAAYALKLTQKRASEIENLLIKLGVKPTQLQVVGLGDANPIESNSTEQGRLNNTRITIIKN
jgi:outer membrane protein OmpA-like peptidoglycan-associated protein